MPDLGPKWELIGADQGYFERLKRGIANPPSYALNHSTADRSYFARQPGVASFLTIDAAAKAARDLDIVEISTDAVLGNCASIPHSRAY